MTIFIIFLIILALTFDFLNGFHDSANSIATIVSTRVLSPRYAVIWAAFFNFIAFLFFGLHVANTIGKGIIDIAIVDQHVIFGTLIGACGWNIITWYFGLPTSSSHALIGGMIGSALLKAGPTALVWKGILKTVSFIFISPVVGLILGLGIGIAVHWIFRRATPSKVDHIFRKGHYCEPSFQCGIVRWKILHSVLGGNCLPHSDCFGNNVWRLADCENDGTKSCKAPADRRILRGNRRCHNAFLFIYGGHSCQYDTYHYWCDYGNWVA